MGALVSFTTVFVFFCASVSCLCVFKFAKEMDRRLATAPCFSIVIGSKCISDEICVGQRHFKKKNRQANAHMPEETTIKSEP